MINVKTLKEIIKDIPDDVVICFGDDDNVEHHIQGVDKAEICSCDYEEHDALVFSGCDNFNTSFSVRTVYEEDYHESRT